jgi:hypothetical protein
MLFIAERYLPGARRDTAILEARRAISECDRQNLAGLHIRYVGSTLVPDDEISFLFFTAPSLADVIHLLEVAAIPCQHVGRAVRVTPGDVRRD